jgi:hypothetical protein
VAVRRTAGALATLALLCAVGAGVMFAFLGFGVAVVLCQLVALFLLLLLIPLYLNLSRTFYGYLLGLLFVHVAGAILQYALLFRREGLNFSAGVSHSFRDALYFSVTTWTTVGYGDFTASPSMRLVTSAEALVGTASLALAVSYLWLFVSEQPLPSDQALLDGSKFHLRTLTWHRLRIRGLQQGHRAFDPSYIDRPAPGSVVYRDKTNGRWEILQPGAEVPQDADTIRFT